MYGTNDPERVLFKRYMINANIEHLSPMILSEIQNKKVASQVVTEQLKVLSQMGELKAKKYIRECSFRDYVESTSQDSEEIFWMFGSFAAGIHDSFSEKLNAEDRAEVVIEVVTSIVDEIIRVWKL